LKELHTWTDEEIARFEKRWPMGTRERLALDLLLYTDLARGDVVRLGKQHVANGVIAFRMKKIGATAWCTHRCCQSSLRPLRRHSRLSASRVGFLLPARTGQLCATDGRI